MTIFTVLHFVKRFVWDLLVFTQYSYFCDFFCLGPKLRLRYFHCHGWVRYILTTKITVFRFVWDCSVFTQSIHYCDFFCLGIRLCLCNHHCHGWVHYTYNTNIMVWCMSSLLLSIDLQSFCDFIMFYFKLTNGTMVKWWMKKWFNGEIKISIGRFVSRKYQICSFILFLNIKFLQQVSVTFDFWSLTTNTATKFMLSNQVTTEQRGFIRVLPIVVREIVTLI